MLNNSVKFYFDMEQKSIYKITGYVSVLIGILASLCIYRIQLMKLGIGLSIIGFIISGINIYLNTKYYSHIEKYPKGYWGMLLSSLPVLFMLFVIFKFRK